MPWWNRLLGEPSPEDERRSPDAGFAGVEAELARARAQGEGPGEGARQPPAGGEALLGWLAERLGPAVLAALEQRRDQFAEAILSDPPVLEEEPEGPLWRCGWRLFDGRVATLTVQVEASEAEPPVLRALVGDRVCAAAPCPPTLAGREELAAAFETSLRGAIAGT